MFTSFYSEHWIRQGSPTGSCPGQRTKGKFPLLDEQREKTDEIGSLTLNRADPRGDRQWVARRASPNRRNAPHSLRQREEENGGMTRTSTPLSASEPTHTGQRLRARIDTDEGGGGQQRERSANARGTHV